MSEKSTMDKDYSLIELAFSKQEKYHNTWLKSQRYLKAKHPDKFKRKGKEKKKSTRFIPVIRNAGLIIEAIFYTAFFSNGNPIEVLKYNFADEDFDIKDINKVVSFFYKRAKPAKELSRAFLSAIFYKLGITLTYWDRNREKTVTRFIRVKDFAIDPECSGIDDIEYVAYRYRESNREIKNKIDSGFYNKEKKKKLEKILFTETEYDSTLRKNVEVLYKRYKKGYMCKTFINKILVKETFFKHLPYEFGYCFDSMPDQDDEALKDQNLAYGGDIVELLEELNDEMNEKRNLKNDMQNQKVHPSVLYGEEAKVKSNDLTFGYGKATNVGNINQIKFFPAPDDSSVNDDIGLLQNDVPAAVGTNSILEGDTSGSDRRSERAISSINANSSMRIQKMIMLMSDTHFEHWANNFVRITLQNASDEQINEITGKEYPFGKKGSRKSIKFELQINFGMTVDKEKRINDLFNLLQMIANSPNIKPEILERIMQEVLNIRLGNNTNLNEIFASVEKNDENKDDIKTV